MIHAFIFIVLGCFWQITRGIGVKNQIKCLIIIFILFFTYYFHEIISTFFINRHNS